MWWDVATGLEAVSGHSSTWNPVRPTVSAKRPKVVRLAQVRTFPRRERTCTQRAPLPPRRIDNP
jgi:hypothetical protein